MLCGKNHFLKELDTKGFYQWCARILHGNTATLMAVGGSPAWIRTTIHGSKGRCPTIRRPGIARRE